MKAIYQIQVRAGGDRWVPLAADAGGGDFESYEAAREAALATGLLTERAQGASWCVTSYATVVGAAPGAITDSQIQALRADANKRGAFAIVALCDDALDPDGAIGARVQAERAYAERVRELEAELAALLRGAS